MFKLGFCLKEMLMIFVIMFIDMVFVMIVLKFEMLVFSEVECDCFDVVICDFVIGVFIWLVLMFV